MSRLSDSIRMFKLGVAAALAMSALAGGCGKDDNAPKSRVLNGRVTAIDINSGIVEGSFYIEKQKTDIKLSGKLAPNAEIFINGKTAGLEDVLIDDRVKVTGLEERHNGEKKLIATKVEITRPTTQSAPSPGESTGTAPAGQ